MQCKSYSHFFSKKFQHICVSLDVNFNKSLTNDIISFELGPGYYGMYEWRAKAEMILDTCAGLSESAYFARLEAFFGLTQPKYGN